MGNVMRYVGLPHNLINYNYRCTTCVAASTNRFRLSTKTYSDSGKVSTPTGARVSHLHGNPSFGQTVPLPAGPSSLHDALSNLAWNGTTSFTFDNLLPAPMLPPPSFPDPPDDPPVPYPLGDSAPEIHPPSALPPLVDTEPATSSHAPKQKQAADFSSNEPTAKKKTKTRSCHKCGKLGGPNGCRGAARVDYCNNPCRLQ